MVKTPELMWYVAEGSAGFTSDPSQAKPDIYGHPIIAPGYVNIILKQERRKGQNVLDMLWESLLDAMEKMWEIDDKDASEVLGGEPAKQAALNVARGHALGLAQAIAAQKHTALYLDPETREQAIDLVRNEAMEAFDGES